jgi:peptidoglycan/xylan/chitin deacetylase (PgdA/CDA1 family)
MNKIPNYNSILWTYQNPVIIYYHMVSERVQPYYPRGTINPEDFSKQIKYLKKNFTILSLPEAIERASSNNRIKNSLVLTIDDGFTKCHSVIAPILNDEKIPATFFLIENCIDNKSIMWIHQLEYLQQALPKEKINEVIEAFTNLKKYKSKSYSSLQKLAKKWNMNDKDDFTDTLWDLSSNESIADWLEQHQPYMNIQQIKELINAGFTIGSHSVSHPSCDQLDYNELKNEIVGSSKHIAEKLGIEINYFAYPFGRRAKREYENRILATSNIQCLIGGKPRLFRKNTFPFWEAYNFEKKNSNLIYHLFVNSFSLNKG